MFNTFATDSSCLTSRQASRRFPKKNTSLFIFVLIRQLTDWFGIVKKPFLVFLCLLCGLYLSCEVPTTEYDNPLDVITAEEEGLNTPALVFFPDEVSTSLGASVTLQIFALDVENLAGSRIDVSYDKNKLSLLSTSPGDFFEGSAEPVFFYEDDPALGQINIYTSFLGGDSISVSGTGSLVSLVFTTISAGQTILEYDTTSCELRDPDDNTIEIKGFGIGVVNAE